MPKIERTKKDDRMLKTLIEDFERGELRTDHPLQRNPGRWNTDYRDGEIATIIKGEDIDPIKICEQIDVDEESSKKIIENWLIDGLQRLTYPMKYMLGAFRLGNNIEFPIVTFMRARKDVDGLFVMENGRRIYDEIEFDLRGKAFKDLPPELQSDFESYSFSIVKQLDCTNEEVGYHIRRYNKQSNMNGSEKTITYLDTIAETIKEISAHKFFKDNCTKISQNEKIKGAVNKIVIETLMILNYFEDWTKDNKKQGLYLEEKATEDDFNGLKNILDRLANTITEENETLFTSKNTFIWIKMFDYFTKNFNLPDEKFSEFLSAFINKLREKDEKLVTPMKIYGEETDHCTYKALDESKSTKDKGVVNNKSGFFAEWRSYDTVDGVWYYGSSVDSYDTDEDRIIILNPDGFHQIKKILEPEKVKSIYVYSNIKTIRNRLKKRGDKKEEAERRIGHDLIDFKGLENEVDKIVYNNEDDNLDDVVQKILSYITENK